MNKSLVYLSCVKLNPGVFRSVSFGSVQGISESTLINYYILINPKVLIWVYTHLFHSKGLIFPFNMSIPLVWQIWSCSKIYVWMNILSIRLSKKNTRCWCKDGVQINISTFIPLQFSIILCSKKNPYFVGIKPPF